MNNTAGCRAQPYIHVPQARIIAAGGIISEAASFARRANIIARGAIPNYPIADRHCAKASRSALTASPDTVFITPSGAMQI